MILTQMFIKHNRKFSFPGQYDTIIKFQNTIWVSDLAILTTFANTTITFDALMWLLVYDVKYSNDGSEHYTCISI